MDEFGHTQDKISLQLAKAAATWRTCCAFEAAVFRAPRGASGHAVGGHARALVGASNAGEIAELVISRGLNVRQTENLIRAQEKPGAKPRPKAGKVGFVSKDVDTLALEQK